MRDLRAVVRSKNMEAPAHRASTFRFGRRKNK
jgi:hypothetical protein